MTTKKTSTELIEAIEAALAGYSCESKKMFGARCYFVGGNMFAGAHQDVVFLRLSEEDRVLVMNEFDEITPFEPMDGKPMREYVAIPESVFSQSDSIMTWIDRSHAMVSSMPKKEKKPAKKNLPETSATR